METKITHYVCPVCSGKSTAAQKLQNLDPENTLLIEVYNDTNLTLINQNYIKGCKFKTVIIDNFLKLYKNKKNCVRRFIDYLKKNDVEEIILFSTPDRLYDINMDERELRDKFLDPSEVDIKQSSFYQGLTKSDRTNLISILGANEFETKVLGALYSHQNKFVMS